MLILSDKSKFYNELQSRQNGLLLHVKFIFHLGSINKLYDANLVVDVICIHAKRN
jgi:hypothetical protein